MSGYLGCAAAPEDAQVTAAVVGEAGTLLAGQLCRSAGTAAWAGPAGLTVAVCWVTAEAVCYYTTGNTVEGWVCIGVANAVEAARTNLLPECAAGDGVSIPIPLQRALDEPQCDTQPEPRPKPGPVDPPFLPPEPGDDDCFQQFCQCNDTSGIFGDPDDPDDPAGCIAEYRACTGNPFDNPDPEECPPPPWAAGCAALSCPNSTPTSQDGVCACERAPCVSSGLADGYPCCAGAAATPIVDELGRERTLCQSDLGCGLGGPAPAWEECCSEMPGIPLPPRADCVNPTYHQSCPGASACPA